MNLKQITADLRQRIVFGEFSPGDILPRRSELVAHYDSSVASFQKCINQLIQEGFLESCGSKGTIVCENLPNHFQIGLVVPVRPDSTARIWDPFWELLLKAADEFQAADPRYRFKRYYTSAAYVGDWEQLIADLATHQLAGIFLLEHQSLSPESFDAFAGIPVVVLGGDEFYRPNILPIGIQYCRVLESAMLRLRSRGCKNIMVLKNPEINFREIDGRIIQYMAERGFELSEECIQSIGLAPNSLATIGNLIKLMFSPNLKIRPDGLVILNENLCGPALQALRELNLIPARDVRIVSHANFGRSPYLTCDVEHLGIDVIEYLRLAVERLRTFDPSARSRQKVRWIEAVWRPKLPRSQLSVD